MSDLLPKKNADGECIVPMTEEQKYVFDLKGWLLIPGLLDEDDVQPIREHQDRMRDEPDSLPPSSSK